MNLLCRFPLACASLRCAHVRGCSPSQEVLARRREDVNYLGIFGKETFVLCVAGNNCYIARSHRPPLVSDPKIHPPLEHPDNLLVSVFVWSGTCARLDLPPDDHSLLDKDATFNLIIDVLPRQSCKLAEARNHRHDVSPLSLERPNLLMHNRFLMRQVDRDVLPLRVTLQHAFEREFAADAAFFVAAVGVTRALAQTLVDLNPTSLDCVSRTQCPADIV